jgi:hypothetical protein
MNVYDAIMKAAEHIEQSPSTFHFGAYLVPSDCGSPGCALGWIGMFAGRHRAGVAVNLVAKEILGVTGAEFYDRMAHINAAKRPSGWWRDTPQIVAENLRAYAAKYHAPPKRTDAELVTALMARVTSGERIPEDA